MLTTGCSVQSGDIFNGKEISTNKQDCTIPSGEGNLNIPSPEIIELLENVFFGNEYDGCAMNQDGIHQLLTEENSQLHATTASTILEEPKSFLTDGINSDIFLTDAVSQQGKIKDDIENENGTPLLTGSGKEIYCCTEFDFTQQRRSSMPSLHSPVSSGYQSGDDRGSCWTEMNEESSSPSNFESTEFQLSPSEAMDVSSAPDITAADMMEKAPTEGNVYIFK